MLNRDEPNRGEPSSSTSDVPGNNSSAGIFQKLHVKPQTVLDETKSAAAAPESKSVNVDTTQLIAAIIKNLNLVIANEKKLQQVTASWERQKTSFEMGVNLKNKKPRPHLYIEIISLIRENYKTLDASTQTLCNPLLLDCTQVALSQLTTVSQDKLEKESAIACYKAQILSALQLFPDILKHFNLNLAEEASSALKIIQSEGDDLEKFRWNDELQTMAGIAPAEVQPKMDESSAILKSLGFDPDEFATLPKEAIEKMKTIALEYQIPRPDMDFPVKIHR